MTAMNKCDERKDECNRKFAGIWNLTKWLIAACFIFTAGAYGYTFVESASLADFDRAHIQQHVVLAANVATKDDLVKLQGDIKVYIDDLRRDMRDDRRNYKRVADKMMVRMEWLVLAPCHEKKDKPYAYAEGMGT